MINLWLDYDEWTPKYECTAVNFLYDEMGLGCSWHRYFINSCGQLAFGTVSAHKDYCQNTIVTLKLISMNYKQPSVKCKVV